MKAGVKAKGARRFDLRSRPKSRRAPAVPEDREAVELQGRLMAELQAATSAGMSDRSCRLDSSSARHRRPLIHNRPGSLAPARPCGVTTAPGRVPSSWWYRGMDDSLRGELDAIKGFLLGSAVPILLEREGKFSAQGTGALLRIDDALFLVTAAHVTEGLSAGRLFCPRTPRGAGRERLRGTVLAHRPPPDFDVAVFHLHPEVAETLDAWRFLTLADLLWSREGDVTCDNRFVLCGFPEEIAAGNNTGLLSCRPFLMTSTVYQGDTSGFFPPLGDAHLLLAHAAVQFDVETGLRLRSPRLHGISGATIWNWGRAPASGLWAPERALKAVAVETGVDGREQPRWIKGTKWFVVAGILHDNLDALGLERLRKRIVDALGPRQIREGEGAP